jgi:hypothetical protein
MKQLAQQLSAKKGNWMDTVESSRAFQLPDQHF